MNKEELTKTLKLYGVTDSNLLKGKSLAEVVNESIKGGATIIQLREKTLNVDAMTLLAKELKDVCHKNNVPLIINDNIEVSRMVNADGLHIGQGDISLVEAKKLLPNKIIGVSVQNVKQAIKAYKEGADYLGVGAMFDTTTKLDAETVSKVTLKEICNEVDIPVVAIGGINLGNISELKASGVSGVAVVSALYKGDVTYNAKLLMSELNKQMIGDIE